MHTILEEKYLNYAAFFDDFFYDLFKFPFTLLRISLEQISGIVTG